MIGNAVFGVTDSRRAVMLALYMRNSTPPILALAHNVGRGHMRIPKRLLLCLMISLTLRGGIIADSVAEFSSVQGQDNWMYGYYDGPFTPADFTPMTVFSGAWWVDIETTVTPENYWTNVGASRTHGQGIVTSGGRTPLEQWAVRRWVSEVTGTVYLNVNLAKAPNGLSGNGVIGHIFVGGTEVWNATIAPTDQVGVSVSIPVSVTVGQNVDLALDPRQAHDQSDTSVFTVVITDTAVPEPSTVSMMVAAFISLPFAAKRLRRAA